MVICRGLDADRFLTETYTLIVQWGIKKLDTRTHNV